jgi:hypothetical protein
MKTSEVFIVSTRRLETIESIRREQFAFSLVNVNPSFTHSLPSPQWYKLFREVPLFSNRKPFKSKDFHSFQAFFSSTQTLPSFKPSQLLLFFLSSNKMTRSSDDNMANVADEVNQMDTDYGKNFKILNPNDQIKGKLSRRDIVSGEK